MKGTSKVIMGATLIMVVSLAMVLGLILVLLAELYCSLLLRRRRSLRTNTATAAAAAATSSDPSIPPHQPPQDQPPPSDDHDTPTTATATPLGSFYAHGVLKAPRSLLFPAISLKEGDSLTAKKQTLSSLHHQVIEIPSPQQPQTDHQEKAVPNEAIVDHFVYISNPVYENTETPFETPDTSPSRLEMAASGSSGEDDEAEVASPMTPPLTPMKKLPAEACSVSLRDARSLATSGSDSNSNNGRDSSSSSASPCTSPSW